MRRNPNPSARGDERGDGTEKGGSCEEGRASGVWRVNSGWGEEDDGDVARAGAVGLGEGRRGGVGWGGGGWE
jgi:hypothetical protein